MSRQPRTLDTLALAVSHLRGKGPSPHMANELAGDVLPVVRAMVDAARKFKDEFDAEVANRDGQNPLTDPGCVACTSGTTPYDRDTGSCGYHALEAALAAFDAGALPAPLHTRSEESPA